MEASWTLGLEVHLAGFQEKAKSRKEAAYSGWGVGNRVGVEASTRENLQWNTLLG